MSLESAIASRDSLLTKLGKRALNVKYPKEFELYVIAFELVDENFKTLKYFIFPINPSSIEESKPEITNIKKTLAGISVLNNMTFIPTDINITGNFGRNFKVLLGGDFQDFISSFTTSGIVSAKSISKGVGQVFDERVKTGYGCTKILEEIINESKKLDNGKMRHLIFHNPALGNSYFVKPINLRFNMNEQTNMIWSYSLQLKTIAPLEAVFDAAATKNASLRLNTAGYLQQQVNKVLHNVGNIVGNLIYNKQLR